VARLTPPTVNDSPTSEASPDPTSTPLKKLTQLYETAKDTYRNLKPRASGFRLEFLQGQLLAPDKPDEEHDTIRRIIKLEKQRLFPPSDN